AGFPGLAGPPRARGLREEAGGGLNLPTTGRPGVKVRPPPMANDRGSTARPQARRPAHRGEGGRDEGSAPARPSRRNGGRPPGPGKPRGKRTRGGPAARASQGGGG